MVQIYITHVQDFGPFLKIFGQTSKGEAIKIEKAIRQLTPILNTIPQLQELHIGATCLGKYSDGNYYRSRITGIGVNGLINIFFLDYGNEDVIHWFEIRLLNLDNPYSSFLKNVDPQASVYILARSVDQWKPQVLEFIRSEICNENFEAKIETKVIGFDIISFKFKGQDYSESIFRRKFCNKITTEHQCDMILYESRKLPAPQPQLPPLMATQSQLNNNYLPYYQAIPQNQIHMHPSMLMANMQTHLTIRPNPPSTMIKSQSVNNPFINNQQVRAVTPLYFKKYTRFLKLQEVNQQQTTSKQTSESQQVSNASSRANTSSSSSSTSTISSAPSIKTEVATFKSTTLSVGTTHEVYCSFVEDGPNLFSIQLASGKPKLTELMRALAKIIEKSRLKHLSEKPSPGKACIVHDVNNKRFYRAVIMNISAQSCQVVYVDYGQTEYVTYQSIYEIPVTFLKQEVFAMKFALSGYKDLQPLNDVIRNQFKELVLNKKLFLKVVPLEGAPFVQYCELYDGKKSVLNELKNTNTSKSKLIKHNKIKLKYAPPTELQKGASYTVTIRYVESPQKFFVQLVDQVNDYENMMDGLLVYCQRAPVMTAYSVGDICAAKFDENDNEWYRVEITKIVNEQRVCIRFVDFGNPQEIDCKSLREISPEFVTVPQQSVECVLKGFESLVNITDTARVQLEMFSEDERGERKQLHLTVVDKLPTSNIALVNLLDKNCTPPLNISRRMYILSMPPKNFGGFQNDGNNNINKRASGDAAEILNSTVVDKFNNNDLSTPSLETISVSRSPSFTSKPPPTIDQTDSSAKQVFTRSNSGRRDGGRNNNNEHDSWKSTPAKVFELDSWKSGTPQVFELDSWKSNMTTPRYNGAGGGGGGGGGVDTTNDSWKSSAAPNRNERDANKFSNNRNENFRSTNNKIQSDSIERTTNQQQRYDPNANRGHEKFTKPKYEGKNLNTSESSGKYSWTSDAKRKSDQSTENDSANMPRSKSVTPVEIEYVAMDVPYKKPTFNMNEKYQVQMQWWISPYHFYVQLNEYEAQFEAMVKAMQKFYRNRESIHSKPNIGDSVVSCSQQTKIYCRATILNYNEELKKYKIKFIDFGNTAIVTFDNLWQLEKRFTILPQLAIRCSLTKGLLQTSIDHIMEVIGSYIPTKSQHQCEFMHDDGEIYYVNYFVNNNLLFDRFVVDELIVPLPEDININRLIGQTVLAKYKKIINFNEFYVQIDGFDITLPCSYPYGNKYSPSEMNIKIDEFKEMYENQFSPLKIEYVSEHFILLGIPVIPLLDEEKCPAICDYPILSNKYDVNVIAVESDNALYVQVKESENVLGQLLDDMYNFYDNGGNEIVITKEYSVCAAKSPDGNWYRGLIQKENEHDSTQVLIRYIDYGNTENVPKTNLKFLEPHFCNISALSLKIYLPMASISTTTINERLTEITIGYKLTFEPIDFIHDHWIGDLTFENRSIIDILISKQFVKRVETSEMEKQIEKDNEDKVLHYIEINNKLVAQPADSSDAPVATNNTSNIVKSIDSVEGLITHVDNPESFYIQLSSHTNSVNKLHENIQIIAQSLPQLDEFKKGTTCIAKYSVDEEWYRAKIIDFGAGVITILFMDYGNADVITEQNKHLLKIMPNELKTTDPYAFCCSLPIHPIGGASEWNEEAIRAVYDLNNCNVQFEYISKVGPKKYINLFHNNRDVGKFLVASDFAEEWETIKTGEKCYISHCNSPSDFYIQLESDTNNLELISEYLNSNIERFPIMETFTVDTICSAQFPEDNEWYRAKILFHNSTGGTEVLFIDYGNTAFTEVLRVLPQDIADLPILSKKCSLHLPNYITKWSEEAESKFQSMAAMGLTIFDVEMYAPGETITVNLYDNGINIFKTLEPLCQKHNIESMTESIVDEIFTSNDYMLNGYEGVIAHINSPNDFYVHFTKDQDALNELIDYFEKNGDQLDDLVDKTEGKMCVAKFNEDNKYYRAKILTESNDGCEVLFIDYGNISFTSILKEIPESISNLDFIGKHCALRKFTNCYDNWNEKASSFFVELGSSDEITFQINIIDKSSDPYIVNLFLGNRNILAEMEKIEIESDNKQHEAATLKQCTYELVNDICQNLNINGNNKNDDKDDDDVGGHGNGAPCGADTSMLANDIIQNIVDEINLNDGE